MDITYSVKQDAFTKEIVFCIDDDKLSASINGVIVNKIDLIKIVQVRMKYAPTRYVKNKFVMEVKDLSGQSITISKAHYLSLGKFEDRGNEYREFVLQLHKKLANVNNICKFTSGATQSAYTINFISLLFVIFILIFTLFFMIATGLYFIIVMHLIFIIYYLPASLKFIKVNKPKNYFPNSIPNYLLPNI